MSAFIDLRGLDKAAVLAALYNAGNAGNRVGPSTDHMSIDEAQSLLDSGLTCFGLIRGRPMHIDLTGDTLRTAGYDEVNFPGAAARAIEPLLAEQGRTGDGELGRLAQEISQVSQRLSALESKVSDLIEALGEELDLESNGSLVDDGAQELVDRMALREEEG